MLKNKIMWAGYCLQKESNSIKGGRNEKIKFHAMFALINHPERGCILYDTGYGCYFYEATAAFPYSIYAKVTPVFIDEEHTAKIQLQRMGINPADIKYVIISHFHADHIGGLRDFESAKYICLKSAYESIKNKSGFSALTKAFLPKLLPADFENKVSYLVDKVYTDKFAPFDYCYDIFGDGSVLGFDLSGHAEGQLGIITDNRFFVADACYHSEAYRKILPPPLRVRLLLGHNKKYLSMLDKLHEFSLKHPDIEIIPTHCNEIYTKYA